MADDHHDAVLVPGTYQLERGVDLLRRRADCRWRDSQCLGQRIGSLQRTLPLAGVNGGNARICEDTSKSPGTLLAGTRQHTVGGFVLSPLGVPKYKDSLLGSGYMRVASKDESQ